MEAELVAGFYACAEEGLIVEELGAGAAVVKFVAHELAVGAVEGQAHFFDHEDENAIDGDVIGGFDIADSAAGDVEHSDLNTGHE